MVDHKNTQKVQGLYDVHFVSGNAETVHNHANMYDQRVPENEASSTTLKEGRLLSRRTQRPVESTAAVHVLPVVCPLLLPDRVVLVIAGNLRVPRRTETGESHDLLHLCLH